MKKIQFPEERECLCCHRHKCSTHRTNSCQHYINSKVKNEKSQVNYLNKQAG
jgi:hypothetical protein